MGSDDLEDAEAQAEALAESVLTVSDWRQAEAAGLSAREYVSEEYGVESGAHPSEEQLRAAIAGEPAPGAASMETAALGAGEDTEDEDGPSVAALAEGALAVSDAREAAETGETAVEYLDRKYDLDASEFDDEISLRDAKNEREQKR